MFGVFTDLQNSKPAEILPRNPMAIASSQQPSLLLSQQQIEEIKSEHLHYTSPTLSPTYTAATAVVVVDDVKATKEQLAPQLNNGSNNNNNEVSQIHSTPPQR